MVKGGGSDVAGLLMIWSWVVMAENHAGNHIVACAIEQRPRVQGRRASLRASREIAIMAASSPSSTMEATMASVFIFPESRFALLAVAPRRKTRTLVSPPSVPIPSFPTPRYRSEFRRGIAHRPDSLQNDAATHARPSPSAAPHGPRDSPLPPNTGVRAWQSRTRNLESCLQSWCMEREGPSPAAGG